MPFVNQAKPRGYDLKQGDAVQNCAICTAAGVLNLLKGSSIWTTKMIAEKQSLDDNLVAMGKSVDEQAENIKLFISNKKTDCKPMQLGNMNNMVPYDTALNYMLGFQERTVFAICVLGSLKQTPNEDGECHWLNALKAGGTIRYFDFQSNRENPKELQGHLNPASSTSPFIGIRTQLAWDAMSRNLHSTNQAGTFDTTKIKCVVIAFT